MNHSDTSPDNIVLYHIFRHCLRTYPPDLLPIINPKHETLNKFKILITNPQTLRFRTYFWKSLQSYPPLSSFPLIRGRRSVDKREGFAPSPKLSSFSPS